LLKPSLRWLSAFGWKCRLFSPICSPFPWPVCEVLHVRLPYLRWLRVYHPLCSSLFVFLSVFYRIWCKIDGKLANYVCVGHAVKA
jgi:hypothetical protein